MSATRYDLLAINSTAIPDVKKGTLSMNPTRKKNEFECMDGSSVMEVLSMTQMSGTVTYNGLMESELQTIVVAIGDGVVTLSVYDPATPTTTTINGKTVTTGTTLTFYADISNIQYDKILHDSAASAWSLSFDFKKIGDVPNA